MRRASAVWLCLTGLLAPTLCAPSVPGETGAAGDATSLQVPSSDTAVRPGSSPRPPRISHLRPSALPGAWEAPPTVADSRNAADWSLTLGEVRRIALANNKDIAFVKYMPMEAQAVITAQREEVLGVVRYNQAITRWEYAKGTILDRSNVVLAEEIPPPEGKKSPQAAPHEQTVKPLPSPRKKTTEEPQRFPPNMVIPEPNGYD